MTDLQDIIVIGGGPAGLSAAITASDFGLNVLVLDEQHSPGGQLYRNIERADESILTPLGPDYTKGLILIEQFRKSGAKYYGGSIVWNIESDGTVYFSNKGRSTQIHAKYIIIAIGATERPVPFAGWNLPGVMGAGAIDANFKSSGTVPDVPVVLAGSGPILLLVIGHLVSQGVEISAVLDTTPKENLRSSLPMLPRALRRTDYLLKGVGMLLKLKRSGVKYYKNVIEYRAIGSDHLKSVSFLAGDKKHQVESELLLVHEGIVPRCDFSQLLDLKHHWDKVQRYWYPETNQFGATKNESIYIAGDGAFVHGGIPAVIKGSLAALDIAAKMKLIPAGKTTDPRARLKKELSAELAPRPFVDTLYKPRSNLYGISDETLVCRCEEVTAGDIRRVIKEGCQEPNEIKALTRCGMGQCQGRMCGAALAEIVAAELELEAEVLHPLNIRAPVRNISLLELSKVALLENSDL